MVSSETVNLQVLLHLIMIDYVTRFERVNLLISVS